MACCHYLLFIDVVGDVFTVGFTKLENKIFFLKTMEIVRIYRIDSELRQNKIVVQWCIDLLAFCFTSLQFDRIVLSDKNKDKPEKNNHLLFNY